VNIQADHLQDDVVVLTSVETVRYVSGLSDKHLIWGISLLPLFGQSYLDSSCQLHPPMRLQNELNKCFLLPQSEVLLVLSILL
jgi:hypothetical protein